MKAPAPAAPWPTRTRNARRHLARHVGLVARGRLERMPTAMITDEFGFSLVRPGWHPFVALLDGVAAAGDPNVETDFERFLRSAEVNTARDLNDLLDLSDRPLGLRALPGFRLGTYPWGGLAADQIGRPGPAFGWAHDEETGCSTADLWGVNRTIWYRPDRHATLANERRLMLELAASISNGYRPHRARGFPRVTVLRRRDGCRRAVIVDGHHRLAALAHLGATRVVVEIEAFVDEADAATWIQVRNGYCSVAEARRIFDAFFELNGSERYQRVSRGWG
jgi:hypothetical protein